MQFNSVIFAIFLPTVFVLYWYMSKNNLKLQNLLLLISSYFFYAFWDWRFLFLLLFSTFLDYVSGLKISQYNKNLILKKSWFCFSVIVNLGFLCVFKYYNFFATSFVTFFSNFGLHINPWTIKVILPIGISFYTFHGLSYVIDIYYERIKPEKNLITYAVFVSFFPLLVAGPIERATHLLPQIKKKRIFDYSKAVDGLKQILWGLFKKVVIADNCATVANVIFENYTDLSGSTLVIGAFFFSFQIYGDFSGYSDIAIGTAKLFGIDLLKNFNYPYFSRDIAEFWRRWHISLSSWFKDYLYIPLGGSKVGTFSKIRNTFIIFIVSGFWHGANWTFIAWGIINAFFVMPSILFKTNRKNIDIVAKGKNLPTIKEFVSICITFSLTTFAWIFFRSENLENAFEYVVKIFSYSIFSQPYAPNIGVAIPTTFLIIFFLIIEWLVREQDFAIKILFNKTPKIIRFLWYYLLIILIFLYLGSNQEFIYFQF